MDATTDSTANEAQPTPGRPRSRGAHRAPRANGSSSRFRRRSASAATATVVADPPGGATGALDVTGAEVFGTAVAIDDRNGAADDTSKKSSRGRHRRIMPDRPFWQELPLLIIIALVAAFILKTFFVQVFFIPSVSMENTLLVKDRVLVDKLTYDFRDIKRGEVIVFDANGVLTESGAATAPESGNVIQRSLGSFAGALGLAQSDDTDYIKRVIGLPGDRIACCDAQGRMTVNGVPLTESDYLFPGDVPSTTKFDVVVPKDKLWVMGDHRSQSADSRSRIGSPGGGFVPIDRVVGRAVVRSWPLDRLGTLPIPDTFKQPAIEQNRGTPS